MIQINKKKTVILISVFFVLLFLLIKGVSFYKNLGLWLVYSDDISDVKPDVVFVFAGGGPHRANYGVELMKKYPDAQFVISERENGSFKKIARLDVPDNVNIRYVLNLNNTMDEVSFIRDSIKISDEKKNLILASSPYHMRRIKILAKRKGLYKKWNVYLSHMDFDKSPYSEESFKFWYKSKRTKKMVVNEFWDIVFMNFMLIGWI